MLNRCHNLNLLLKTVQVKFYCARGLAKERKVQQGSRKLYEQKHLVIATHSHPGQKPVLVEPQEILEEKHAKLLRVETSLWNIQNRGHPVEQDGNLKIHPGSG